ncbi:unnamed protein product [Rhizoctonia solani]|uniref:Transmembrane protein n=1 Tax=Rhizoctonia solani TaxID=456999 RepID=A0A8H2ZY23_9AGAM|nr:unnamed protein product [Rhizoctonia solani]
MSRQSPVYRFLSLVILLSSPLVGRAQSATRRVDDAYIHNPNQPNSSESYLDGIQYHPAWAHSDGESRQFNATYSSSTQPLTNLIYFFQGNAIYYYGETGGSDHAPVIIYLDGGNGVTIQTNTSASSLQYQQLLWNKTDLGQGDHQIIITHGGGSGEVMGLDYFVVESDHDFTPSDTGPAASKIPREAIIVDDINSDHFTYSGWETQVLQSENNNKLHYNNTMHRTTVPGSSATFKFTGTAVWYITNLHPLNGQANITLNGVPNRMANTGSDRRLAQRIVWSEQNLAYGEHTVVVTHQDTDKKSVTVDYFMYLPGTEPPQESSSPTGAIVGGVVGGVALIALCAAGWIFAHRRRAAKLRGSEVDLDGSNGPPTLMDENGTSRPALAAPAWGYVTTPYVSEGNENSGALSNHDHEHGPRKGQLIRPTPPALNVASSGPTDISSEYMESYTGVPDSRDEESNASPPPYVRG